MRAKFEEWEDSQDAKDQMAQMAAYDENGEPLETASILRRKFEALRMHEEKANATPPPLKAQFRPKRFKVRFKLYLIYYYIMGKIVPEGNISNSKTRDDLAMLYIIL